MPQEEPPAAVARLLNTLQQRITDPSCESCGSTTRVWSRELVWLGVDIAAVPVICARCGYIRLYSEAVLMDRTDESKLFGPEH